MTPQPNATVNSHMFESGGRPPAIQRATNDVVNAASASQALAVAAGPSQIGVCPGAATVTVVPLSVAAVP